MPDRVHAAVQPVQSPLPQPVIDRVFAQPELDQLAPRDDPVLGAGELGNRRIRTAGPLRPGNSAGWGGLAAHGAMLARQVARVARGSGRFAAGIATET